MQRQLSRLTAGAHKKSECDPRKNAPVTKQFNWIGFCLVENVDVLRAAEGGDDAEDRECKTEVADAVRDESFA